MVYQSVTVLLICVVFTDTPLEGHTCGFPPRPLYGSVRSPLPQYSPGAMAQYVCNNNRMPLHGPTNATCNSKGQWMPPHPPICPCKKITINQVFSMSIVDKEFSKNFFSFYHIYRTTFLEMLFFI